MFTRSFRALALAAVLTVGAGAPALAVTTAQPQHLDLQTAMRETVSPGAWQGRMSLTITADGIVQGIYRPDYGNPQPVSGGLTGDNLWLTIGTIRPLQLTGTLRDGKIVAHAPVGVGLLGPDSLELTASAG